MNGTTHEFRQTSVPIMDDVTRQWPAVFDTGVYFDGYFSASEANFVKLDEQIAACYAIQVPLESTSCQHRVMSQEVKRQFDCDWTNALCTYDLTEKEVRIIQIDRIRALQSLTTVQCLLVRTTE